MQKVFDSAGISGIEEEFDVAFNPDFVKKHPEAVRGFVADFIASLAISKKSRTRPARACSTPGIVQADPKVYISA